jgi:hypothetical protein
LLEPAVRDHLAACTLTLEREIEPAQSVEVISDLASSYLPNFPSDRRVVLSNEPKEIVVFGALSSISTMNSIVLFSSIVILSNSNHCFGVVTHFPSYSSPLIETFINSIQVLLAVIMNLFNSIDSPARVILPLPTVMLVDPAEASILSANFSLVTSIFPPWNTYVCNPIPAVLIVALAPVFFSTTLRSPVFLSWNLTTFQ